MLLLIAIYDRPLLQVLQTEQFAGQVIATLIGSIGLVLAVPLTTAVGVAVVRASRSIGTPAARPAPSRAPAATRDGQVAPVAGESAESEPIDADPIDLGPPEAETGLLPATKWRAQSPPSKTDGTDPTASEPESRRRHRSRRREDDDFGDFTYLRDPTDTDPGGSTGRRSR